MLGRHKRGAKVVIGKSGEFPAVVSNVTADALENELSIISGGVRELRRCWSKFRSLFVVSPGRGAGPGFQVYRLGDPEPPLERRGEVSPVHKAKTVAHAAPVHVALKTQGEAD